MSPLTLSLRDDGNSVYSPISSIQGHVYDKHDSPAKPALQYPSGHCSHIVSQFQLLVYSPATSLPEYYGPRHATVSNWQLFPSI